MKQVDHIEPAANPGKKTRFRPSWILFFLFVGVLIAIPQLTSNNYLITILVNCMAFAIFGLCWNIIGGYGSQISWSSSAFVAIGAYSNYIMSVDFNISPFLSIPVGMLLSYLMATLVGYGTFKLRGVYFSIATIAFAETLRSAIQYFSDFTKGTAGIYVTFRGDNFWFLTFRKDSVFFYIMLVLMLLALLFTKLFTRSKTGYYLSAIKGNEVAAESLGIETFKVKLRAFQISAVLLSIAGCFYASFLTYISPASTASLDLSIKIGVVAIIGGIGTLWGPVLGAFIVIPLIELAGSLLGQSGSSNVLYGLLLIVIVIFRPKGVISLIDAVVHRFRRGREHTTAKQEVNP